MDFKWQLFPCPVPSCTAQNNIITDQQPACLHGREAPVFHHVETSPITSIYFWHFQDDSAVRSLWMCATGVFKLWNWSKDLKSFNSWSTSSNDLWRYLNSHLTGKMLISIWKFNFNIMVTVPLRLTVSCFLHQSGIFWYRALDFPVSLPTSARWEVGK